MSHITSVFGTEFNKSESVGVSTTTSTNFQSKISITTPTLPAGMYRIGVSYGWNHDSASNDFEARVMEDGSRIGQLHKQEPKDSAGNFSTTASNQRHYLTRTYYRDLSAGTHDYDIEFRTSNNGTESSMWDVVIEMWRVG